MHPIIPRIALLTAASVAAIALIALHPAALAQQEPALTTQTADQPSTVALRVFDDRGELVGPIEMPRLELTEEEWRERLTPEQFRILRNDGTEPPFCGTLLDNKMEGVYCCAGCGLPLFTSDHKFKSGTGWPSFFQPIAKENIVEHVDRSHGMVRTEIVCARCGGHLGHVFPDGPQPTGLRYCLNSEALVFTESNDLASIGEVSQAVFAGGCFWCTEAVFEQLAGVIDVESGYAGGDGPAEYNAVITGTTGHAEAIRIVFDPEKLSYKKLLEVHFATHDPTTLNRQGADVGTQYRSAIFYADETQKAEARAYIDELTEKGRFRKPIVTTLEPLENYSRAEEYHQDYAERNPDQGYIRAVSRPKVEKAREKFPELLKDAAQAADTAREE